MRISLKKWSLTRLASLLFSCLLLTVTSCGTIHTYGGLEADHYWDMDGGHHHHKHHKPKKHKKHKKYKKHKKHHHHDDDDMMPWAEVDDVSPDAGEFVGLQ